VIGRWAGNRTLLISKQFVIIFLGHVMWQEFSWSLSQSTALGFPWSVYIIRPDISVFFVGVYRFATFLFQFLNIPCLETSLGYHLGGANEGARMASYDNRLLLVFPFPC
jgi:hypothetical protein